MSRSIAAAVMIYFWSQWVGVGMAVLITLIVAAMQQQDEIRWEQRGRRIGGGR